MVVDLSDVFEIGDHSAFWLSVGSEGMKRQMETIRVLGIMHTDPLPTKN